MKLVCKQEIDFFFVAFTWCAFHMFRPLFTRMRGVEMAKLSA